MMRARAIGFVVLSAAMALGACAGEDIPGPEALPDTEFEVSDPRVAAAGANLSTTAPLETGPVLYISLPSGKAPRGVAAVIRNITRGSTTTAFMFAGGFDPVPVRSEHGDALDIDVRGMEGTTVLRGSIIAPSSARPVVVRTSPSKGKRDVPLNSIVTVVFSEPLNPQSVTPTSIQLRTAAGVVVNVTATLSQDRTHVELTASQVLAPNTEYRIAVTSDVRDASGEGVEPVNVEFVTGAAVPANMSQIAVSACPTVGVDCGIWAMNADGSGVRQVSQALGSSDYDGSPAWSPDARQIAFTSLRHCAATGRQLPPIGTCRRELYVMNADGSGIMRLTDQEESSGSSAEYPAWSPDGTTLLFTISKTGSYGLYEISPEGSGLRQLAFSTDFSYGRPSWAPDGRSFVLSGSRQVPNAPPVDNGIYYMNADGSGLVRLTQGRDGFPSWSPSGKLIAFQRNAPPWHHIMLLDVETGLETQVTPATGPVLWSLSPSWSPDSRQLVFTHTTTPRELLRMTADGSRVAPVLVSPWAHFSLPSWSRNGSTPPPP